jgi:hypothetical protein
MPSMHPLVTVHGHYSPQTAAPNRAVCPGCGRLTAVHHIGRYLWVHDRWNLDSQRRELCPGTYFRPSDGTWAFTRGGVA